MSPESSPYTGRSWGNANAVRRVETPGLPPYYVFPHLEPHVFCGFTTRAGGVSVAPFDTLNLGTTTRDEAACVEENRRRMSAAFGHALGASIRLEHGCRVVRVDAGESVADKPCADAVITCARHLPVAIYYADCVPVILVDPRRRALALVHAGWRGTMVEVSVRAVEAMQEAFGTDPADLLGGIGSSIGPCCFEVGPDVKDVVCARFPQWQESLVSVDKDLNTRVDLWNLNLLQLEHAGVPRRNIAISRLCTACRDDLFFSYRRDRGQTGRLAMLAVLP